MEFSQPEWDTGFSVPGVFKLDHLQPVEPMLFPKFSNFCALILERPILITLSQPDKGHSLKRMKMGKWNSPNLSETQVCQCLAYSNWTICSLLSPCCSLNFPTFAPLYWRGQFLLLKREKGWKWGNGILPTRFWHVFFSARGTQTGPSLLIVP